MLPGFVDAGPTNLKALTEGIHSKEALELVREHLMSVMGPATLAQFSNVALKMSKFQMAQVRRIGWGVAVTPPFEETRRLQEPLVVVEEDLTCSLLSECSCTWLMNVPGVCCQHHVWLLLEACGPAVPAGKVNRHPVIQQGEFWAGYCADMPSSLLLSLCAPFCSYWTCSSTSDAAHQ
jgi:hypothetical protein